MRMKERLGISVILIVCIVLEIFAMSLYGQEKTPGKENAYDWPHWRGPKYNGISEEADINLTWPADGPPILWKAEVGIGFAAVSVSNGLAYTMGNINDQDVVFCFDALTGEEKWRRYYDCPLAPQQYEGGPNATPTVYRGRVYTFSKNADLFCFDALTGEEIWNVALMAKTNAERPTWGFSSSPLALGNLILLNVGYSGLAVNAETGKVVWDSNKGQEKLAGYATLVPFTKERQRLVLVFASDSLAGIKPEQGAEMWRFDWPIPNKVNAADPIINGNEIFISTGYGVGCALVEAPDNGGVRQIWRNKNMRNHFNSCVLWKDHLYGFDENQLRCLKWENGDVTWTQRGLGKASLMCAAGNLIILSEQGELVIAPADPEKYEPVVQAKILNGRCWTMPVLANGVIYVRNAAGTLAAVDVRKPQEKAPAESQKKEAEKTSKTVPASASPGAAEKMPAAPKIPDAPQAPAAPANP